MSDGGDGCPNTGEPALRWTGTRATIRWRVRTYIFWNSSFQIFAHSFPSEDIISDAKQVLKNLAPIDREVTAMNGRYYTLRIAPYRTTENSIRGLVITIIDSLEGGKGQR